MSRKSRILIVHNYYQVPGGEDAVVENERKMLENNGHKVILYTRSNSEINTLSPIGDLMLPFTSIFSLKTYYDIKKIIKSEKIDIVHVHNTLAIISPSVYYAALACKVPVVQTVHNFRLLCPGATLYRDGHICEDCIHQGLNCAIKHKCYRNSYLQTLACVLNAKIHRFTGIYGKIKYICLTEFNKEKLLQLKQIKPESVYVKSNAVEGFEEIIEYENRENQFIYASRLDELKGIDILFEAWAKLGKDAPKLIVCGDGPMRDWCRNFLKEHDCNIEMLGHLPSREVRRLTSNSKAMILPTRWYEGSPMSIIESFSVNTPVICSDLGNAGNLVTEGITGTKIGAGDATALSKKVNEFKYTKNNSCYEEYTEKFSFESNYEKLEKIYNSIAVKGIIPDHEEKYKKKVLIVHNYYQIPGGEDTVVATESKMLENNGHEVVYYTRNNSEIQKLSPIGKLLMPINTVFNLKTYLDIKKIIRQEKIEIVHVHNTLALISPSVYYAARACKVPVVQTVHNFRFVCPGAALYRDGNICEECISKGLKCALKHKCYRNSYFQTLACVINTRIHRMTGILGEINYICLTDFNKSKLLTLKQIHESQVYVKPNAVENYGGNASPSDYYVFVGRIEEVKGIELAVEAFKKMPDKKLKVIGRGSLRQEIKDRIANEGIHNVELLGYRDREEINKITKGAKALIMCSQWYEPFGMVILEAYSNGVPVIAGDIGNASNLVTQGETGILFQYDSIAELCNAVESLSDEECVRMGRNCYNYYLENFSLKNNCTQLEDIYDTVV